MVAKTCDEDRDRATDLYLLAGLTSPVETSRLECLWGRLFNHGVESPK